jgi:hypothetical protein
MVIDTAPAPASLANGEYSPLRGNDFVVPSFLGHLGVALAPPVLSQRFG